MIEACSNLTAAVVPPHGVLTKLVDHVALPLKGGRYRSVASAISVHLAQPYVAGFTTTLSLGLANKHTRFYPPEDDA
jgi:hypothetical protein